MVDELAGFAVERPVKYARRTIDPADVKKRVLDLVVPPWSTEAQREALQQVVKYGAQKHVQVKIVEMQ